MAENNKTSYSEKLKDPRWQKKRLEIMQRDGFKCCRCSSDVDTLTVHHKKYEKGKDPWESKNEDLITFCESCHSMFHRKENIYDSTEYMPLSMYAESYTDLFMFEYFMHFYARENGVIGITEYFKSKTKTLER